MPRVNYGGESPYKDTAQTNWYLLPLELREIPPHISDKKIKIRNEYNERPALMSYDLYGTPNYWWVFMVRNMDLIRDPIGDFTEGKEIWVPDAVVLNEIIKG